MYQEQIQQIVSRAYPINDGSDGSKPDCRIKRFRQESLRQMMAITIQHHLIQLMIKKGDKPKEEIDEDIKIYFSQYDNQVDLHQ